MQRTFSRERGNMTIYDISKKAGVSTATVSRVLNGSINVSEATRQKVMAVIEKYDYTPNAFARGLGLNSMKTIGIMCADSSDIYLAKAIFYLEQKLRANGYDSILCCTGYELSGKKNAMNLLITKKVDGIILAGSHFFYQEDTDNQYIVDAAKQVPVMLMNALMDAPNVYSITSDEYTSTYGATKHLLASGISDILYFYNAVSYSGQRKLAGFRAAMEESGFPLDSRLIQYYSGSPEDMDAMVEHLTRLHMKGITFHGILASDDLLALAAVKYAKQTGYSVPEDFSVIGYNNSILVKCCDPELTSIDNKSEKICQHLINTLMGVLCGTEMPGKTILAGELIRRGTTR